VSHAARRAVRHAFVVTALLGLAGLGACHKKAGGEAPAVPAAQLVQTMTDLSERACACDTDKECLHGVRDEFDAQKVELLKNGARLTGADKQAFDDAHHKMGMCGDAGGLTFWDH